MVTGRARGYLVSLTAGPCYGDTIVGEWHKDGCAGMALGCSPLSKAHPGVLWGFWRQWKIQTPFFWEGWIKGRAMVRVTRGCGSPRMQMLDLTSGRRAVASKYPPAMCSLVPVTYILSREIISHISSCKHSRRVRVAIGKIWAELKVKLWEQPRSVLPWHVGWHSRTGTGARARATSGTDGDPSRCPLCRYGNVSFNAFTVGAYIHPGAIKVFVRVAAGTSRGAVCGDRFYVSSGQAYAHGTYGHMRVNVYISCACVPMSMK